MRTNSHSRFASLTLLVSLLTLNTTACGRSAQNDSSQTKTETDQKTQDVENVSEHPERFMGKKVVLSGEIDDVYGDRAFELQDQGDLIFEDKVLVLTKSPVRLGGAAPREDDEVVVRGKVRRLRVADVERDLGWDLQPEIEKQYGSKPVVIADSIERVARTASWSEREQNGGLVGIWSVYAVVDPAKLAGQKLALTAVPVQSMAKNGFWVGYQHSSQLFVKSPDGSKPATGDLVDVNGTLEKMPPAHQAIQRFGIDPSLQKQVDQEVVYLDAKSVSPSRQQRADVNR